MLNIAELSRRSGLPRRVVQNFADQGVLAQMPETGGETGVPRLFSNSELTVARALLPLTVAQLPVALLRKVAEALREQLIEPGDAGWSDIRVRKAIAEARSDTPAYLVVTVFQTPALEQAITVTATTNPSDIGAAAAATGGGATLLVVPLASEKAESGRK